VQAAAPRTRLPTTCLRELLLSKLALLLLLQLLLVQLLLVVQDETGRRGRSNVMVVRMANWTLTVKGAPFYCRLRRGQLELELLSLQLVRHRQR
jgi:hypothetical protein